MAWEGEFAKIKSLTEYEWVSEGGIKLLYVDCLKSVTKMSTAKLVKIQCDQETLNKLKSSSARKQIVRKEFINSSPEKSNISFKFSVIATNYVNVTLENDHSSTFVSTRKTYDEWINSKRINDLLRDAHFDSGAHDHLNMWKTSEKGMKTLDIFGVYHREVFEFGQEVSLPVTSSVTVTAFSRPVVGRIPFEAVYELTPFKAGDDVISAKILETALAKYGKQKRVEITSQGTVPATFDGLININSGNEVHLDIKSVPINNLSESDGIPISFPSNQTGGAVQGVVL